MAVLLCKTAFVISVCARVKEIVNVGSSLALSAGSGVFLVAPIAALFFLIIGAILPTDIAFLILFAQLGLNTTLKRLANSANLLIISIAFRALSVLAVPIAIGLVDQIQVKRLVCGLCGAGHALGLRCFRCNALIAAKVLLVR